MTGSGWQGLFAVDGYALYVWVAYLLVFGGLAVEVVLLLLRGRNIRRFLGAGRWRRRWRARS